MITRSPSRRAVLTLALFATSCIALTIYLWLSFGGVVPLAPAGYHMYVSFADASGLTDQADVRISGVNVGKVVSTQLDQRTHRAVADLNIDPQYAPRPLDTHAILRQKSALGEVYVELSPGSPTSRKLPDGGSLAPGQVQPAVRFSDLLQTFDPATRRALTTMLTQQGIAFGNNGQALNQALFDLAPLAAHAGTLLAVTRDEQNSTDAFINASGQVLGALAQRRGQLAALAQNSATVFRGIAARDAQLAQTVRLFPGFLSSTDLTLREVSTFAQLSTPRIEQLDPVARAFAPLLTKTRAIAPALGQLLAAIGPLARASRTGLPAFERLLALAEPVLARSKPYFGGVVPIVQYLELYHREIAGLLANATSATQATYPPDYPGPPLHYIRASVPINPEALAAYPDRLASNRSNAYLAPDIALQLKHGLPVFGGYLCTSHPDPALSSAIPSGLRQQIQNEFFTTNPSGPPCRAQGSLGSLTTGQLTAFPDLKALP